MKEEQILKEFNIDNCRVCIDINEWRRKAQNAAFEDKRKQQRNVDNSDASVLVTSATAGLAETGPNNDAIIMENECPPDSIALGRATWTFLHTMAAYFPEKPTPTDQKNMTRFITLFSEFYPCGYCASHLRSRMKQEPPQVASRPELSQWFCRMHNEVNARLGKPLFDCSRIDERWRDGPKDGYCD